MDFKAHIAARVKAGELTQEEIYNMIALPPTRRWGTSRCPVSALPKPCANRPRSSRRRSRKAIPRMKSFPTSARSTVCQFSRSTRVFWTKQTLERILSEGDRYGSSDEGKGKTVCIDYSSVNIAKPFHIGHLSTTVLGSALYKLHKFLGYTPVGINHLGDYGTQFGKLISAYKRWGKKETSKRGACARSTRCTSASMRKRKKIPPSTTRRALSLKRSRTRTRRAWLFSTGSRSSL